MPTFTLDEKPVKAVKAFTAKKTQNTYFGLNRGIYGVKVDAKVLPNGLQTAVAVDGVTISTTPDDEKPNVVRGAISHEIDGTAYIADVYIKDHQNGTFQLRLGAHRPGGSNGGQVLDEADLF